jgi:hypothetical protein
MTRTLTGLFDTFGDAEAAVRELESAGIRDEEISVVASRTEGRDATRVTEGNEAGPGASAGAGVGAVIGGGAGVLAGLGILAIPGVGPVVAAGWLVAAAVGAVGGAAVGGAGGGLIGAMIGNGVPEHEAHVYAEGVRRGGAIVTVRVNDGEMATAEAILARHRRVDPVSRGENYRKTGWSRFNENAPPYSESAAARERRTNTTQL